MPIRFNLNRKKVEKLIDFENIEGLREEANGEFIYKHMNNGSGICPACAPWLGMQTSGDGGDGVPVPPLHPRCKCFLMPADVAIIDALLSMRNADKEVLAWNRHFEWMKTLSKKRLAAIVGKVRANLVFEGKVTIEDLYSFQHLKPLKELGFNARGVELSSIEKVEEVLTIPRVAVSVFDFHEKHWSRLPAWAQGVSPRDSDAVKEMLMYALPLLRRKVRKPGWLVLLIGLLREILPADALVTEKQI